MTSGSTDSPAAAPLSTKEMLDRLGRSLAHNLNNRLTGVIGYLELALQEPGVPAPAARHLRTSLDCALDVVRMMRRVVAFALRPQHIAPPALFAAQEFIEQAVRPLLQRTPALDVQVHCQMEVVAGEPRLIRAAFDQVLDNAAEAVGEGGTVSVRLWEEGGRIGLAVHDNGPGLAEAVRHRLFEPFVSTKSTGHLGLGLAIARTMMEAAGGDIRLDSDPGEGTTAVLSWPANAEAASPLPPGVRVDPGAGLGPPTRRVGTPVREACS